MLTSLDSTNQQTQTQAPTPTQVAVSVPVTPIVTAVPTTHFNFAKFMAVLAALEPLVIAGVSPFIKNPTTQQIVANETPIAQTLINALSQL